MYELYKKNQTIIYMSTYKQKFNKKYGFKLSGLKTIFEKGEGAFETNPQSVRKGMQKQQWAYSRVYAAVNPSSKAHKIDKVHLKKK